MLILIRRHVKIFIMTKELEARLISFVRQVAKGCDVCPHLRSTRCQGCYGEEARELSRDIDFKPWTDERDERDLSIIAKLSEDTFSACSGIALDCGMTRSVFAGAAARLAKLGIVEVKGRWIRKTKTK